MARKAAAGPEAQAHSASVAQGAATRMAMRRLDTGLAGVVVRRHLLVALDRLDSSRLCTECYAHA